MLEDRRKAILFELYTFSQDNRLEFYTRVKFILEQSQCAIISKPYWPVVDGTPGAEVFTIFPDLECSACDRKFKCKELDTFIRHVFGCLSSKDVLKSSGDYDNYVKYKVVPRSVGAVVDKARTERDHRAVCIAPVLDHPEIKKLAELQRKERERLTEALAREDETMGPTGPIIKLAKGAEMPLDRMVWIQTPLTSELATLLLAGMQPIRHAPRGIHLPIVFRETGLTKVIHLNVDRFEELSSIRTAEQNYEMMRIELQQVGVPDTMEGSLHPCIPDVMTGDPKDSFDRLVGKSLNLKRPNELLTEKKITQKVVDDIDKERKKMLRMENGRGNDYSNRRTLAEIPKDKEGSSTFTTRATATNVIEEAKKANGDQMKSRLQEPRDDKPGCSKYI